MLNRLRNEPALLWGAIAALLTLAAAFGLSLDATQVAAVSGVISIITAYLGIRPKVTPVVATNYDIPGADITTELLDGSAR